MFDCLVPSIGVSRNYQARFFKVFIRENEVLLVEKGYVTQKNGSEGQTYHKFSAFNYKIT